MLGRRRRFAPQPLSSFMLHVGLIKRFIQILISGTTPLSHKNKGHSILQIKSYVVRSERGCVQWRNHPTEHFPPIALCWLVVPPLCSTLLTSKTFRITFLFTHYQISSTQQSLKYHLADFLQNIISRPIESLQEQKQDQKSFRELSQLLKLKHVFRFLKWKR